MCSFMAGGRGGMRGLLFLGGRLDDARELLEDDDDACLLEEGGLFDGSEERDDNAGCGF